MLKKIWPWLLAASVLLNAVLLTKERSNKIDGQLVVGVIDGDTLVLEGKTRVRLRYVDAPETGLCGSGEAVELLKNLTLGKKVRLEGIIPDQYGRGMAIAYLGNRLINKEMVASGWVRYHSDESAEKEEVKKAGESAREARLGVFGKCELKIAANEKCVIKGNIDFDEGNRKTYHLPGCVQYKTAIISEDKGERWFCTEAEARKAGFTKSKTCK
ncbi:thermonuclease family protein [Candidatus Collierbacteria bacterium]|nr:thermonuclease family protein [Candidatus Collierbacteria bacterium]